MVHRRYLPLHPDELQRLAPVVDVLMEWQTKVRPFGPEYDAILQIKAGMNALADATGALKPFPPAS